MKCDKLVIIKDSFIFIEIEFILVLLFIGEINYTDFNSILLCIRKFELLNICIVVVS